MNAHSYLKPGAVERIFGRLLTLHVRIGLIRGHFYVLEVRGRKSGSTLTLPVDPPPPPRPPHLPPPPAPSHSPRTPRAPRAVALARPLRRRRHAPRPLPPALRPPTLPP